MYTEQQIIRILQKDLEAEFRSVAFYLKNLQGLNHAANKKKIKALVEGSFKHASMIADQILSLDRSGGRLSASAVRKALKEENGMLEMYRYEKGRMKEKKAASAIGKIAAEEEKHAAIVRSLK